MSAIPAHLGRAPDLLLSRLALGNINRTNLSLLGTQTQLATGRMINRASDDAVKAAVIAVLDSRLERSEQHERNLQHATASLNILDTALADANELILEAEQIALAQANFGSSTEERAGQAVVVSSLLDSMYDLANRSSVAGHLFGGSIAGASPVSELHGGYRYHGAGSGVLTDVGGGLRIPITLPANNPVGTTSTRVRGLTDLRQDVALDTRLEDLNGARGLGVDPGLIEFSFDGGENRTIDLQGIDTVGDVIDALESALLSFEQETGQPILGPGGITIEGDRLAIDVMPDGNGGPDPMLEFSDIADGVTAADLGLMPPTPPGGFVASSTQADGLSPKLTWRTPVLEIQGQPLGSIRLSNLGQTRVVDLSQAQSLQDIRNLIENAGLGLRVEINDEATGIDVFNEVSHGRAGAMSIEEIEGNNLTATRLGIRTYHEQTPLSLFNDGRGINIVTGQSDPVTGNPDPTRDVDFTITLGDGTEIDVDLRPEDISSVETLIARINDVAATQLAAVGLDVPTDFEATLLDGRNGLAFVQNAGFPEAIGVTAKNNSTASMDLGLRDGSWDAASATFVAEDRAKVRVPSAFTYLMDLRDALLADDVNGIALASEDLHGLVDRIAQTRALVGGYAQRIESELVRQEDNNVLDERIRSELRDLDYTEAATRFSLLQTQLQASLQTATLRSASLLDFLG